MKRMLWILNPHAGRGAMSGKIIGCETAFQQAGYDVTIYITQGAQDATRVARERAGEFDRIVCAGGDGTLNEVITGLMQAETRPVLGYVPAGTTNDFASSLGISKVPAEAAVIAVGTASTLPQRADGLVIEIAHRTLDFCLNKTVFRLQIKRTVLENQIIPFGDLH